MTGDTALAVRMCALSLQWSVAWSDWEGQLVDGQFRLRQYLGGSQSSAVYLTAFGDETPRNAAIKLIAAEPQDDPIERWKIASGLTHPHLIQIFAYGQWQFEDTPLFYVVMEQAEEDLSQILPTRPLTAEESRDMLDPALEALAYLHGKGLAHGHLKPSNVMAIGDRLKISADGLLRVGESDGSPAGDVWSLGLTLVEALTQRLPAAEELDSPETAFAGLPSPFDVIVSRCLQRDPQNRWTVAEIIARLRGKAAGNQRRAMRRRIQVPVAVGAVVALGAIALIGLRLADSGSRETPPPSVVREVLPQVQQEPVKPPKAPPTTAEAKKPAPALAPEPSPTVTTLPANTDIVRRVDPDVPAYARNTIRGSVTIRVRLLVDPSGNVAEATLDSPGPSKYFAERALETARQWKFKAPSVSGRDVSSRWNLQFTFARNGTKVVPARTAP